MEQKAILKKRGAPQKMREGKPVNLYLSSQSRAEAEIICPGNISAAVRQSLKNEAAAIIACRDKTRL